MKSIVLQEPSCFCRAVFCCLFLKKEICKIFGEGISMEKIITASGKGVQAGNRDFPENVQCLQIVLSLEKLLGEKIPGNRFEAGRIFCGRKKQKQIERQVNEIRSWVRFLRLSEEEVVILTPSLKILDEKIQPLTLEAGSGKSHNIPNS
ncbi:MAG: hypothetical protein LIP11_18860 [Clostridiales bacterium]|nr:hypothetical protein [Clostridiales bacterium]